MTQLLGLHRLALALALVGATFALGWYSPYGAGDRWMQDFFATSLNRKVSEEVVLVVIDDKSLAQIGRWPWSRAVHAALLQRIERQEPHAIGLDLLLTEPSDPLEDRLLADTMGRAGRLLLPVFLGDNKDGLEKVVLPLPIFAEKASGLAHVHVHIDPDGMVRSVPSEISDGVRIWPHLALEMGAAAPIHMSSEESLRIPYAGETGLFKRYSYVDVLQERLPPNALKNKRVLVGVVAAGMGDAYVTPAAGAATQMPGVEIIAHLLDATLQGVALNQAKPWINASLSACVVALALVVFFGWGGVPLWSVFALTVGVLAAGWGAANLGRVLISPFSAICIVWFGYLAWSALRMRSIASYFFREVRQIQLMPSRFSKPMPTDRWTWLHGDALEQGMSAMTSATKQLSLMHAFVEGTLDGLPDPVLVVDQTGTVKLANTQAVVAFGISRAHLESQKIHDLLHDLVPVNEQQPVLSILLAGSLDLPSSEMVDSQKRHWIVRSTSIFMDQSHSNGWIISLNDVSSLRQAEAARDEAMQFVSHDMRSPQTSIIALIDSHRLDGGGDLPEEQIEKIEQHVMSSLDISNGFVRLSQAKAVPFKSENIIIGELLQASVDEVWPRAQLAKVEISSEATDAHAVMVRGDALLLRRALVNLLINAIKFSPPSGRVTVVVHRLEDRCRIDIQDQGPGVSPQDEAQLFQSFSTLNHSHGAHATAIGLGLRMVRVVAERHGGRTGILRKPNTSGACFYIDLPLPLSLPRNESQS
jgi:CHASE2 domain-containing sensor protein/signal transduction histidine kinase